jgi:primosomal protein N' (replication factor Y)
VLEYYLQKDRIEAYEGEIEELEQLSETQKIALEEINKGFEEGKNILLHGVTSSGKTHLYLDKIEETISKGKNVLFSCQKLQLPNKLRKD